MAPLAPQKEEDVVRRAARRSDVRCVGATTASRRGRRRTVGPNSKKPPSRIKRIREIDGLYLCLQHFDIFLKFEAHAMAGNGSHVNILKHENS